MAQIRRTLPRIENDTLEFGLIRMRKILGWFQTCGDQCFPWRAADNNRPQY